MSLKHFIGLFAFLACFTVSVLLIGFPIREKVSTQTQDSRFAFEYLQTQQQIQKFLENDRQTGRELADDLLKSDNNANSLINEELATVNLVRKMQKVNCGNLPTDFCAAWKKHLQTWDEMADFLHQANQSGRQKELEKDLASQYWQFNYRINQSYNDLITSAKMHGVDFPR
jgi:hypothetical protein